MSEALTIPGDQTVTTALTEEQVRQIHAEIKATIEAGDAAIATLRALVGPEARGLAYELLGEMNVGAGWFRTAHARIAIKYRERNIGRKGA